MALVGGELEMLNYRRYSCLTKTVFGLQRFKNRIKYKLFVVKHHILSRSKSCLVALVDEAKLRF